MRHDPSWSLNEATGGERVDGEHREIESGSDSDDRNRHEEANQRQHQGSRRSRKKREHEDRLKKRVQPDNPDKASDGEWQEWDELTWEQIPNED